MSENTQTNGVKQNPTYMKDIRTFFQAEDIACMRSMGIDLGTYEGVKHNALRVFFRTEEGTMPPPGENRPWSESRKRTFYNWMKNDYPRGTGEPEASKPQPSVSRVRKSIADLDSAEVQRLKRAFSEIMDRDPSHPQSYFSLAGIHWLPSPTFYCRHHENAYNSWHRLYLIQFEDALRSVEGCEDVTIPYWDLTSEEMPVLLTQEPFLSYTIPRELCTLSGDCYPENMETQRNTPQEIGENIQKFGIAEMISSAVSHSHWERFNGWDAGRTQDGIIRAHDAGHVACGPTLSNQDVAAFDPLFWFFHANWDRLWWRWQQNFGATNLLAFKTHLGGSSNWLDDPVLNKLPPFERSTAESIDLSKLGVDYKHPAEDAEMIDTGAESTVALGSASASRAFSLSGGDRVSMRVKGVNRLEIPGSFEVEVGVAGRTVARQAFFQATDPKHCETCRDNAFVDFDFIVNAADLRAGDIRIDVRLRLPNGGSRYFPLSACGNPTVNTRLLVEEH